MRYDRRTVLEVSEGGFVAGAWEGAHNGSNQALCALKMYSMRPDKGLEVFSRMALDECEGWHNGTIMKVDLIKGLV